MCQSLEREFTLQQNMAEVQIGITRQNRNQEEPSYFSGTHSESNRTTLGAILIYA